MIQFRNRRLVVNLIHPQLGAVNCFFHRQSSLKSTIPSRLVDYISERYENRFPHSAVKGSLQYSLISMQNK